MKLFIAGIAAIFLITGCASKNHEVAQANAKVAEQRAEKEQAEFRVAIEEASKRRIAAQLVNRPFIAGNSKPLARAAVMPEQLRKATPVTALFSSVPTDLDTALRQLSLATDLMFTATPDALLPPAAFGPRTSVTASPVGAPPRVTLQVQGAPLWTVLDDIARQTQTSWRPVATGAEFYRIETRVYTLSAIAQNASASASLGRNAGSNQVFESQSKSSFESKDMNVITGIRTAIDAMLTTGGRAVISPESGTLVVTDTPAAQDRIALFVTEQNKILSRRVRMVLESIEVIDKDATEVGVDWSLIYATADAALKINSPVTLAGLMAGQLSATAPNDSGRYAGSTVVVKALSEIGVVVNRRVFPLLTTSGRPVTQAVRTTFNYVDQVQATSVSSSSTSTQAPTITQKDETVGTFLTVLPTAKADGTVFLSLSFDMTSAQPLVPFTAGSVGSSVTVQQKTIDGSGIIQEVPLRSGQTVLVGGIESNVAQDTIRRLMPGAPLLFGGSNAAKITKSRMILIVTAVIEEGV